MGVKPDYSLEREGVSLSDWLVRLVGDDRSARPAAGDALYAMWYALPSAKTGLDEVEAPWDLVGQTRRFAQAVRDAVSAPGFESADFVRRLCTFLMTTSRQLGRGKGAATLTRQNFVGFLIFQSLDTALMQAPEALRMMLEHSYTRQQALTAIVGIGPDAIALAPWLIEEMDRIAGLKRPSRDRSLADAIGAVCKGDQNIVAALAGRLQNSPHAVRATAALALEKMGTDIAGQTAPIVGRLLELLADPQDYSEAVGAVASVGRDIPQVRAKVLALASSRPPVMVAVDWDPLLKYDQSMWQRGVAISALIHFSRYPHECMPVLLDAIDSFVEFDPDMTCRGPVGRVSYVLQRLGPDAGSAAVALAKHLEDKDCDFPAAILDALAAMGPAARDALPYLEKLHERESPEGPPVLDKPDKTEDYVGWAIDAIVHG